MRPKTAGGKKSVGFALTGTKIDPPDEYKNQQGMNKFKNTKENYYVNKAKEFESFHQIPKFSHALGAVIHPPPYKRDREVWKPAKNLAFDGTRQVLEVERYQAKNIPDTLIRPAIDEIALMRVKELEKSKSPQKKQRMSLKQEKEHKAEQKRKRDINIKISRAEKNLKSVFDDWKHLLARDDLEFIVPGVQATVQQAHYAQKKDSYVQFLYAVFEASTKNDGHIQKDIERNLQKYRVNKNTFVDFIRFYRDQKEPQ